MISKFKNIGIIIMEGFVFFETSAKILDHLTDGCKYGGDLICCFHYQLLRKPTVS